MPTKRAPETMNKGSDMNQLIFFIGTEAEFIKLFPVMAELEKRNIADRIVSSGLNMSAP